MLFRVRIILDLVAVGLVVACLAYWWLDNLSHELFGTALFVLIIAHNVFNRRRYGTLFKVKRDPGSVINVATIVGLGLIMLIMLVTSVLISRDLFSFMALDGSFAVREIHMFAAYWVVLIIALHLGTRWSVVMKACRSLLRIRSESQARTYALRGAAVIIAVWGVKSSFEMAFGTKLMLTYSLDMWDFAESTLGFFVNYGSIIGLYVAITHYALAIARSHPIAKARSRNSND